MGSGLRKLRPNLVPVARPKVRQKDPWIGCIDPTRKGRVCSPPSGENLVEVGGRCPRSQRKLAGLLRREGWYGHAPFYSTR